MFISDSSVVRLHVMRAAVVVVVGGGRVGGGLYGTVDVVGDGSVVVVDEAEGVVVVVVTARAAGPFDAFDADGLPVRPPQSRQHERTAEDHPSDRHIAKFQASNARRHGEVIGTFTQSLDVVRPLTTIQSIRLYFDANCPNVLAAYVDPSRSG